MPITYNSNIVALSLARRQGETTNILANSYARLSSGTRLNRASDDPAGQSVVSSLNAQTGIAKRGRMNIQDGLSLFAIADEALSNFSSVVERLNELATQAANGSLTATQRAALQLEFDVLGKEITRIKDGTSFNGRAILQGDQVSRAATSISGITTASDSFDSISVDGRYFTYLEGTTLKQRDLTTNAVRTIADTVTEFSANGAGDLVAYYSGTSLYKYDRLSNSTTLLSTVTGLASVSLSADGSTLAILATEAFSSDGQSLGAPGGFAVTTFDIAAGTKRGDGGVGAALRQTGSVLLSSNGAYVVYSGKDTAYSASGSNYVYRTADLTTLSFHTNSIVGASGGLAIANSGVLYLPTVGVAGGANPTGHNNVVSTSNGTTYQNITRITSGAAGNGVGLFRLTDGESTITYYSALNPTGENPLGRGQIFKVDVANSLTRQLTNYTTNVIPNLSIAISGDGLTWINTNNGSSATTTYDMRRELNLQLSTGTTGNSGILNTTLMSVDGVLRGIESLDISTQRGAQSAIEILASNLSNLGSASANIGSIQARLESANNVSAARATELTAASERISSIDYAQEVASMVRLQILAQTQTALMAQSNKLNPQIALDLLYEAARPASSQ